MQASQEDFTATVYGTGAQTERIMENWNIENSKGFKVKLHKTS